MDQLTVLHQGAAEIAPRGAGWHGRMLVLVDGGTGSSGESSAWYLKHLLGATIAGAPTRGQIEFGNVAPYVLPASGLLVTLATKHNDYGIPVEMCGFPVDRAIDPRLPDAEISRAFDSLLA